MRKVMALILLLMGLISCGGGGSDQPQEKDLTLFYRYTTADETDDPEFLEKHLTFDIDIADDKRFEAYGHFHIYKRGEGNQTILYLKGGYPQPMKCGKLLPDRNKLVGQWLCHMKRSDGEKLVDDREVIMELFEDGRLVFNDYYTE